MTNEKISARIKERRKELRLKQQELAEAVGVSTITITRWENPKSGRIPNAFVIPKLAEVLKTTSEYLLEGVTPKIPDVLPHVASLNRDGETAEQHQQISYWSDFLGNIQEISNRGNPEEIKAAENFLKVGLGMLIKQKVQMPSSVSAYNGNNSVYAGNNLNTGTMA